MIITMKLYVYLSGYLACIHLVKRPRQPLSSWYATGKKTYGDRLFLLFNKSRLITDDREKDDIAATIRNLEDKFNKNFHYPYVFLNNEPFTDEFKDAMRAASPAEMQFGLVPKEQWSYPAFVNETYAAECRQRMEAENVFYGGMESYHHMCRYQSGFFFRHPLLNE